MTHATLARTASSADVFAGPLREGRAGWHLVVLRARPQVPRWAAAVRFHRSGADGPQDMLLVRPSLWPIVGVKLGVSFLPGGAGRATVRLFGAGAALPAVRLSLLPIPASLAAAGVAMQNLPAFRTAIRATSGSWTARVRKALAIAAFEGQRPRAGYPGWLQLFDAWPTRRLDAIARALPARPSVTALVFTAANDSPALAATLASLHAQAYKPAATALARPGAPAFTPASTTDCVAVLQAGDVLPPHALLVLVDALARSGAGVLLADEDRIAPDGTRTDPWFKPQPSLAMVCSGLMSRGVWLIRSGLLPTPGAHAWAECLRLDTWFRLRAAGQAARVRRVPHLLTHRRADAEAAPPDALAATVNAGLVLAGIGAAVAPGFPLQLRWHANGLAGRKVSIVVPSRLRGDTQIGCMIDVLRRTAHPNHEMLVVVTQPGPLDAAQQQAAQRLHDAGPVRIAVLPRDAFNYSLANNFGAAQTGGEFVCLLNDDVSTLPEPTATAWLDRMVARLADPAVGIVGAKLYYPDMRTQHAGVVMGLAGLVEHAHRFLPRGEPGYGGRATLDNEFTAVTGACLLIRRTVLDQLGGLDESLPSAYNDIDLCVRARAAGHAVILAADAELVHHETISFGHHYLGAADREADDVQRVRRRWAALCQADPFHNPNLSLLPGAEWTPACPPREDMHEDMREDLDEDAATSSPTP